MKSKVLSFIFVFNLVNGIHVIQWHFIYILPLNCIYEAWTFSQDYYHLKRNYGIVRQRRRCFMLIEWWNLRVRVCFTFLFIQFEICIQFGVDKSKFSVSLQNVAIFWNDFGACLLFKFRPASYFIICLFHIFSLFCSRRYGCTGW